MIPERMPGLATLLALAATSVIDLTALPTRIPRMSTVETTSEEIAPPDSEAIDARVDRHARLTVPVHVDGTGPFQFIIDTGAQRTVLSDSLAQQLDLEAGPDMQIVGIVQAASVPSAHVGTIDLGRLRLSRVQVPLLKRDDIDADGILGTDTLQDQRVLIDFERSRIEVGDADELGGNRGYEIVVRARRKSGQLIVTNARIDGIKVALVFDTGAELSVGNRALQAALGKRGSQFRAVQVSSVTGHSAIAQVGTASKLDLNDIAISNPFMAFTDSPVFAELGLQNRPALFLGMREMRMFRRVAIDFGSRRVLFDLPKNL